MTSDQITQLRTLLEKARDTYDPYNVMKVHPKYFNEALALLPCPTCNGTGRRIRVLTNSSIEENCPDCQPRSCVCCEEITEENAHLHRNCGK